MVYGGKPAVFRHIGVGGSGMEYLRITVRKVWYTNENIESGKSDRHDHGAAVGGVL